MSRSEAVARHEETTMIPEPPAVARIRTVPAPSGEVQILLARIDALTERLKAFENVPLTDEKILAAAGPATSRIGNKDVWELGEHELLKLARKLMAAMRERSVK